MTEYQFGLTYFGRDADQARLDLYDASISYYGFARTLAIVGHYYVTGEIIAHAPKSKVQIYLTPPEEGSFKQNVIAGVVGAVISAPFTTFFGELAKQWVPGNDAELKKIVELLEKQNRTLEGAHKAPAPAGDGDGAAKNHIENNKNKMDVLRSITSNSFRKTFRPVGRSCDVVAITTDEKRKPIGAVNERSLALMDTDKLDEEIIEIEVTVNAFSRSSKTGIAWSENTGRGFRFEYNGDGQLPREDIFSYSQYYGRKIILVGRFVRFFDDTIKKFLVLRAARIES